MYIYIYMYIYIMHTSNTRDSNQHQSVYIPAIPTLSPARPGTIYIYIYSICMYMYVCIYIYICIYLYVCAYTHNMYVCIYIYIYIYITMIATLWRGLACRARRRSTGRPAAALRVRMSISVSISIRISGIISSSA